MKTHWAIGAMNCDTVGSGSGFFRAGDLPFPYWMVLSQQGTAGEIIIVIDNQSSPNLHVYPQLSEHYIHGF
jgi:hypothetical protein